MKKSFLLILLWIGLINLANSQENENNNLNLLLNDIWYNNSLFKVNRAVKKIEKLNPDFNTLKQIIENQILFSSDVRKGFVEWEYKFDSLDYYCILFVPKQYNSSKKYPVTFILHGAIANLNPRSVNTYIKPQSYNTDSIDYIIVYPASWMQSMWWEDKQVKNLTHIITRLKRTYNIDENKINMTGISDGASGCYFQANKNITPWASFRPFIGSPYTAMEYGNQTIFLRNYSNKPFFIVNTEHDHLYPASIMTPIINQIKQNGVELSFFAMKGFEHNIKWFPLLEDTIRAFINNHPRNPYPSQLYWQTNDVKDFGRNHWIIINKLKSANKPLEINTLNEVLLPSGDGKTNLQDT